MKEIKLKVEGIICEGCQKRLENSLNNQDGIKHASVNLEKNEVTVVIDDSINIKRVEEYINDTGFKSLGEK